MHASRTSLGPPRPSVPPIHHARRARAYPSHLTGLTDMSSARTARAVSSIAVLPGHPAFKPEAPAGAAGRSKSRRAGARTWANRMRHWRAGVAIANAQGRVPKTSKPDPRECSEGSQESPRTRRTTQDMTAPSVELTARAHALVLCSLQRAVPARQYRAGAVCCILASFLWSPCVPGPSAYARPARRLACMLSSMPAGCANNISWRAARRIVTRVGRASGIERRDWSSERSRRQVWMLAMLAGDLRSLAQ